MPWKIAKRGDEYCIVKESDGKTVVCHDTREEAVSQVAALEASEKEVEEKDDKSSYRDAETGDWAYIPYTAVTFDEMDAAARAERSALGMKTLANQFKALIDNIFFNDDIEDKARRVQELSRQLIARLPKVFQGQDERGARLSGSPSMNLERNVFSVVKQKDGTYRWLSIWTNKYKDRDNPPDILSEAAHIDFAKAVNDGDWPYPELWFWHHEKRIGASDIIAYDKDSGFSIASGTFDKGFELIAEGLALSDVELGTSHGMPIGEIHRDKDNPSVIVRYRTKEISPLPMQNAANELTGFALGGNMDLSPKGLREKLDQVFGAKKVDELAELLEDGATEAKEAGLEFKETEDAEEETEVKEEGLVKAITQEDLDSLGMEVVKAIELAAEMTATSVADVVKVLQDQNATLEQRIADLERSDEKKLTELADETPRTSIADILASRAVGRKEARVDGRESLAKDKPKEAVDTRGMSTAQTVVSRIVNSGRED